MLRRLWRRFVPTYAILPLTITGITNLLSYQLAKVIQWIFGTGQLHDMTLSIDNYFSFEPVWVLVYIASYLFWFLQYSAAARNGPETAYRLAVADAAAKLIGLIFFIALPTTNVRPAVEGTGVVPFLMRTIYFFDTPTNLFPSFHCFIAWLGTRYIFRCKYWKHKGLICTLCVIGSVLVFLSTLYTKQHVFLDILGGIALAELGYFIGQHTSFYKRIERMNRRFLKTKLSKIM